jgi:hypothetical protein
MRQIEIYYVDMAIRSDRIVFVEQIMSGGEDSYYSGMNNFP